MKRRIKTAYVYETLPAPGALRPPKVFGYGRVSTSDQSTEMQTEALRRAGCEQIITDEGVSGSTSGASRQGLKTLLGALAPGDTVAVWKLDRLGRSLTDLCELVATMRAKGVVFKSITEGFDMSTPAGEFMFHMLGACAQFERAMIRERVIAGIANAKARHVRFGRKPKMSDLQVDQIRRMLAEGHTYTQIMAVFKIAKTTLRRALRRQR